MTVDDGFVPTPPALADMMAQHLFVRPPEPGEQILFPGAGTGGIAAAVHRYCSYHGLDCPDPVAIDISGERLATLEEHVSADSPTVPPMSKRSKRRFRPYQARDWSPSFEPTRFDVETIQADFLLDPPDRKFDYIVANPPYTRYNALNSDKRDAYREGFRSAEGRFQLFKPFVEQMQHLLSDEGTLVFLAPSNYLTRENATAFREELRRDTLQEFLLLPEGVFRHWKVQTVLTSLEKKDSIGRDGHFWIEPFQVKWEIRELLESVGITDESRLDDAVAEYMRSFNFLERLLRSRRKRGGEDWGYDVSKLPKCHNPMDDYQADIGNWA